MRVHEFARLIYKIMVSRPLSHDIRNSWFLAINYNYNQIRIINMKNGHYLKIQCRTQVDQKVD